MFALSQTSDVAVFKISLCFVCKNSVRTTFRLNQIPRPWIRQPLIKVRFFHNQNRCSLCHDAEFYQEVFYQCCVSWLQKYPHPWEKLSCSWGTFSGIVVTGHKNSGSTVTKLPSVVVWVPEGKWPDTVEPVSNLHSGSQKAINTGF